jgi:hypothetical protein
MTTIDVSAFRGYEEGGGRATKQARSHWDKTARDKSTDCRFCTAFIYISAHCLLSKRAFNPYSGVCNKGVREAFYWEWMNTFREIEDARLKMMFALTRPIDAIRLNFVKAPGLDNDQGDLSAVTEDTAIGYGFLPIVETRSADSSKDAVGRRDATLKFHSLEAAGLS